MTKQIQLAISGTADELASLFAFLAGNKAVEVEVGDAPKSAKIATIDPGDDDDIVEAAVDPKEKKRAADRKRKAAAKAKKEADAEADLMSDGVDDEVTLDDVKGAVSAAIKRADLDQVKAVFKAHKVAKISDIKEAHYKTVRDAVEAL